MAPRVEEPGRDGRLAKVVENEGRFRTGFDELRHGAELLVGHAEVEGQPSLGEESEPLGEPWVSDRRRGRPLEQPAHAHDERLLGEHGDLRFGSGASVHRRIGDDPKDERPGNFLHPANLVERLVLSAVGLHEDRARKLVPAGVDVLGAKRVPERRLSLQPVVMPGRGIPEMEVRVEDPGHQRTMRAVPPRITCCTSASVAIDVSPGVVIARAPCATAYARAVSTSCSSSSP